MSTAGTTRKLVLLLAILFEWGIAIQELELGRILKGRMSWAAIRPLWLRTREKMLRQVLKDYILFPLLAGPMFLYVCGANAVAKAERSAQALIHRALRSAGVQNLWLEAGPDELPRLTGIFDLALRLPDPAGTSLSDTVALLKPDGLLFDLHPPTSLIGAYHDAGLEVVGRAALPDGFCCIARK